MIHLLRPKEVVRENEQRAFMIVCFKEAMKQELPCCQLKNRTGPSPMEVKR